MVDAIVAGALDGLLLLDARGAIVALNPAARAVLGDVESGDDSTLAALAATPDARPRLGREIEELAVENQVAGTSRRLTVELRGSSGVLPVELVLSRLPDGGEACVCAWVRDLRPVSALRAAEDAARAEARRWRERSRLLAADAVAAEERERGRLAQALHDDAVQNLLAARQDLMEVSGGGSPVLGRAEAALAETIEQLRLAVFELHPVVLEHAGFQQALAAVVDGQARRAGFAADVRVEPAAVGVHDRLMLSVARELVTNVAKHADATAVTVDVERHDEMIVLRVLDDGRGLTAARREAAVRDGHVGLATCGQRVEALGGRLDVWSRPEGGTLIRAALPADEPREDPGR
jgi:signal transduction histidine kinase